MIKEELYHLAQLIKIMKELSIKLDNSIKDKDLEEFKKTKEEILSIQKEIDGLL